MKKLLSLGVRDSKRLGDKTILSLSTQIRSLFTHSLVRLFPEKYNELYERFGNLNRLLAWGHATAIQELVERQIHHVVRALAVDEHLRRTRIDLLHCVQIHALTNHCRRLRIFCVDLLEALGIALRLRNDPVAIALRVVDHARRVGFRARQ